MKRCTRCGKRIWRTSRAYTVRTAPHPEPRLACSKVCGTAMIHAVTKPGVAGWFGGWEGPA